MINDQRLVFSHHRYLFLTGATCPCLTISSLVPHTQSTADIHDNNGATAVSLFTPLWALFLGTWESEVFVDLFPLRWPSMMALRTLCGSVPELPGYKLWEFYLSLICMKQLPSGNLP